MAKEKKSFGLVVDRYELSMAWAYWHEGRHEEPAIFDYFFRKLPFEGGYAVFAGLEPLVAAIRGFCFSEEQLAFLEGDGFPKDFLEHLRGFSFQGDLWAVPEGEVVFPNEPIVRVEGGLLEAQLMETLLLNVLNFQTLVATKASRCRQVAGKRILSEFGLRRSQGPGGQWASRAACVGGFDSTSNMDAAMAFDLPTAGTMAHSFIQSYDDELEAFRRFAAIHGPETVLLLDTYHTLRSGLPNALVVAGELRDKGLSLKGIRLDSGDLAYLSRCVRKALDEAGFPEVKILASNQIDEYVIRSLISQQACIDGFGIGTSIATGAPDAALDGVYKLGQAGGKPRLKTSETLSKSSLPGRKEVYRFQDKDGMLVADAICLENEPPPEEMVHPFEPAKHFHLSTYKPRKLLRPVMQKGEVPEKPPTASEAADYARRAIQALPIEHQRFENPHVYKVGISSDLHQLRNQLITLQQRKEPHESPSCS